MQKWAMQLKLKKHKTQIEINLSALRHNLLQCKELVDKNTKMLVMVKAQAYGSGLIKTAQFIEKIGIDYLGVAYADEGVENIESIEVLRVKPFDEYGSPIEIISHFGDKQHYLDAVKELENELYKQA